MKNRTLRGVLCTTTGGICWGFSGTCIQYLITTYGVNPLWLSNLRMFIAGILMTILAICKHRDRLIRIWKRPSDVLALFLYGVLGLMMCQASYTISISYANAPTTTVLQNLSLVFIMVITCLQSRRLPNRLEILSLLLAGAGVWLLATGGDPGHLVLSSAKGLFWGILSAAAAAIYCIVPRKRLLPCFGSDVVMAYGMILGGIVLCILTQSWQYTVHLPLTGWLAVAATVFLGTAVAYFLIMQGITDIGPVKVSMLGTTEPVSATVFSAFWLGTKISLADWIGFACIIATIFLLAGKDE